MRPILFNTEMVKAILDGRKTVTRRICKDANDRTVPLQSFIDNEKRTYAVQCYSDIAHEQSVCLAEVKMPICVGDILYVRETWGYGYEDGTYIYKASDKLCDLLEFKNSSKMIYRPSIHMPKEAARIFLQVMGVRCERLQHITDNGAISEGINPIPRSRELCSTDDGIYPFKALWNSVYHNWDENPWVWVIEFERITKEEAQKG